MSKKVKRVNLLLHPADIEDILEDYAYLLASYQNLRERNSVYGSYKRTSKKLDILFPFKEHPVHGITGLHAVEKYDDHGYISEYYYQWKKIIPKEGIAFTHISAWENEPHDAPDTPARFIVKTEPHHHHHIPGERRHRKENYDIRTLEAAFEFIAQYIITGKEYKP